MKKEFLANAIANIGDGYVEEFAHTKKRKKRAAIFRSIGAVGVAAALALIIGLNANRRSAEPDYSYLPKITFGDYSQNPMGGNIGRTGLISKDRPPVWNESMKIKTMPVYMSESTEPNHEKMLAYIKSAAAALGISENGLVIDDRYDGRKEWVQEELEKYVPSEVYPTFDSLRRWIWSEYEIIATAGDTELRLTTDYRLMVSFGLMPKDGIELPSEYDFSADAPKAEREKALSYLAERFKELTGYERYTTYPERGGYKISRASDNSDASKITNSDLDASYFSIVEYEGKYMLCSMIIYSSAGLNKLGDYPIISADEAEKVLKSDRFEAESRMPEDAEILQIEMLYENWTGYTSVMPYYDFYVRSEDSDLSKDIIRCDLYRVPAIPSSFFEGVETGDYGTRAAN